MKKLQMIALAVALSAVLSACGEAAGPPAAPTETTAESTPATQQSTVQTDLPEPTATISAFHPTPEQQTVTAEYAFVYDCASSETKSVVGAMDAQIYPASITKLFTAHIALQYLQPEQIVTAGEELSLVAYGSSVARIEKGNRLRVEMLIEGMLLPSGNDAAYVLAVAAGRAIAGDSALHYEQALAVFMQEMNDQAQSLGLSGTQFVNPDGIHDDAHYSTPRDVLRIAQLATEDAVVMRYAGLARAEVTFESGERHTWKNTNALIDASSEYYSPYACGLKTGQTPYSGSCLVSAFRIDGRYIIVGVFGCPEENDRFSDTLLLLTEAL